MVLYAFSHKTCAKINQTNEITKKMAAFVFNGYHGI